MQKEAAQTGFCTSDKKPKMSSKLKVLKIPWTASKQHLTASDCTVIPFHGRKIWEVVVTSRCMPHMGVRSWGTRGGGCCCCSTKRRKVSISLGWLRGLQLSPQSPLLQSQVSGKECLQAAMLGFAAKGKHIYNERARKHPCSCHMDVCIGSQKEKHYAVERPGLS